MMNWDPVGVLERNPTKGEALHRKRASDSVVAAG